MATELPEKIYCRYGKKGEDWWCKYDGVPKVGMIGCFFCDASEPSDLFVVVDNSYYPRSLAVIFPRMRLNGRTIEIGQDATTEKFNYVVKCTCDDYPFCERICRCGSFEKNEREYAKTFQKNKDKNTLYKIKHIVPESVWSTVDPELPRVSKNIWIDFPTTIEYIPLMPLTKSQYVVKSHSAN